MKIKINESFEILSNNNFLALPDNKFELTEKSNIAKAKNELHRKGLFLRIYSDCVKTFPKTHPSKKEIDLIREWAESKNLQLSFSEGGWMLTKGERKIFLYIEEHSRAGKRQRVIMGESGNKHENITDMIICDNLFSNMLNSFSLKLPNLCNFIGKPIIFQES